MWRGREGEQEASRRVKKRAWEDAPFRRGACRPDRTGQDRIARKEKGTNGSLGISQKDARMRQDSGGCRGCKLRNEIALICFVCSSKLAKFGCEKPREAQVQVQVQVVLQVVPGQTDKLELDAPAIKCPLIPAIHRTSNPRGRGRTPCPCLNVCLAS